MKKNYTTPTVEIIKYEIEDVLLASGMLGLLGTLLDDDDSKNALNDWLK